MFDLPNAKRVRRSDLYARSQSSSPAPSDPDPDLEAQLQSHFAALYGSSLGLAPKIAPVSQLPVADDAEEDAEHEFEFRLFSNAASKGDGKKAEPQKIVLEEEEEEIGEGGFLSARDPRVWVVRKAEGERQQEFESVAVTGEEVLRRRDARAWGLEVPWRVKVLKVVGKRERKDEKGKAEVVIAQEKSDEIKRKRPGKKRRLILRRRKKKSEESAERKRREMEERHEAEREKRTKRNREKKVKRKMKEKAKKAGGLDAEGAGVSEAVDTRPSSNEPAGE